MDTDTFLHLLTEKGSELYRPMPWREDTRGYYVLVSELMLQQTQVARVIPKFKAFIERFADERALAEAPLSAVLEMWQGLGYNRRARYLHEAAQRISQQGAFPTQYDAIRALPGVGKNTAGAIMAYTFNEPSIFIETNVRTVYIHHFFADSFDVDDASIIPLLEATLDRHHPREFYWSLMDYGSWLKASGVRNTNRSKQYKKQSPLEGSIRQVRGQIITVLVEQQMEMTEASLRSAVHADHRFTAALEGLLHDRLVVRTHDHKLRLA